jgi:hypothetical protein
VNDQSPSNQSKFARYRARKKALGLREVRIWVPDVRSPEFQEKLNEQLEAINASKSHRDAMDWIEEVMADDPEFYG